LRNPGCQFRLKAETIFSQLKRQQGVAPQRLVASPDIGEAQPRKQVREQCQQPIGEVMSQRFALRTPAMKPGAVNDSRPPPLDRLQQLEIILRIEFEVGVLDEDDPASRLAESASRCRPLASIFRLKEDADVLRAQPISGRRKNHSAALAPLLGQRE